jgi:hypothetical protein
MIAMAPDLDVFRTAFQGRIVNTGTYLARSNSGDGIHISTFLRGLHIGIAKRLRSADGDRQGVAFLFRIVRAIHHAAFINHWHFHSHNFSFIIYLLTEIIFRSVTGSFTNYAEMEILMSKYF